MLKTLILAGSAAFLLPLADGGADLQPVASGEAWDRALTFTITPAEGAADRVQLSLRHGRGSRQSQYSRTIALSELEGIGSADLLAGDGGPVRFRVVREAGILDCSGTVRGMRGSGDCRFTPDEAFASELARRGIGRPDPEEMFHLAMAGVGRALIAELERQGYARPRVSDLVALGIHGADLDFLRGLDAAGYRVGSLERLVEFRIHGVTPAYITELASLGGQFRAMAPERLVEMRIHGVTPAYARELSELGYRDLGPSQLVDFRIHGVTPAYVREMAEAGYPDLSAAQLVNLRIHGVRPQDAREVNAAVANAQR